jgi:hypothetical protein
VGTSNFAEILLLIYIYYATSIYTRIDELAVGRTGRAPDPVDAVGNLGAD